MINYYEVLEVSQKASNEIIEKAYKVLAKKYHPDLQAEENKLVAKEKMQLINEAYEVLSNTEDRKSYDEKLEQELLRKQQIEEEKRKNRTNEQINNQVNNMQQVNQQSNNNDVNYNEEYEKSRIEANKKIAREIEQTYANAYNNYLRRLGYRVKERWTWKKFFNLLKVLGVLIIIIVALWFIPPTRNLLLNFYEGNVIIKTVVDIFINLVGAIWTGICTFFRNIFNV